MRIIFDVTPLSHPRTGIGNYIRGALRGLAAAALPDDELIVFAATSAEGRTRIAESLDGIPVGNVVRSFPLAHAWRTAWSRLGHPATERFVGRLDVLHFSDWMYPPQRGGVRATTIHDLVPLRFPEWVTRRTRRMHCAKYRNAARTCDLIVCNSAFTARDVVGLLGVAEERVRVARPGVDERFSQDGPRADLGRPYVLTVGTHEPRKNLGALLEAHRLLDDELALGLAGGPGWGPPLEAARGDVLRLGYVSDDMLVRLYRGASVFCLPSRFEGFGLPVLEAMACGVPCVVSSHPSLDEVCGDSALRAEPDDPEELAAQLVRAREERDELVRRGLEHARRFSWQDTGRTLLTAYREAA